MSTKILGFFPWNWFKSTKTSKEKTQEIIGTIIENLPAIREAELRLRNERIANQELQGAEVGFVPSQSDGERFGRLYDFYKNYDDSMPARIQVNPFLPEGIQAAETQAALTPTDQRINKKPVEVMEELERVPCPIDVLKDDLEGKIQTLKDKSNLVNQRFAKQQIDELCARLENRKKYPDFVEFYSVFPNTTDEKIQVLLNKYKLKMDTHELFTPTFPDDAIKVMKEYTKKTEELCGKKPIFYVIAEEKDFVKKREKLDPILLVQSPFGFYWQILGAWDKEMLVLSEL